MLHQSCEWLKIIFFGMDSEIVFVLKNYLVLKLHIYPVFGKIWEYQIMTNNITIVHMAAWNIAAGRSNENLGKRERDLFSEMFQFTINIETLFSIVTCSKPKKGFQKFKMIKNLPSTRVHLRTPGPGIISSRK